MVTFDTVREQLLYEVHDPARYLNPDVVADFTSLTLDDLGDDRVRVSRHAWAPAPPTYKGLVCTPAGWAGEASFAYSWPDAEAKARAAVRLGQAACRRTRACRSRSGARSTSASTRSAGRPSDLDAADARAGSRPR